MAADLKKTINPPNLSQTLNCLGKGLFIGFKNINGKDLNGDYHRCIVELEIPAGAKRSSAGSRKCRCEFAKVVDIKDLQNNHINEIMHETVLKIFDMSNPIKTKYTVGEMVYPDSWDDDRWNQCSHGIHLFITEQEAIDYANLT